jgi:hypothetical protein
MFSKRMIALVEQLITPSFSTGSSFQALTPAATINTSVERAKKGEERVSLRLPGVVEIVIAVAERVVFMHRAVGEKHPAQAVGFQPVAIEEDEAFAGFAPSFSRWRTSSKFLP